jgi:two-component SAPR family response regulator
MTTLDKQCILIVEDEYYLAKDLMLTLKDAGGRILGPFPRKEPAMAALEIDAPDCAIIDVNLGGEANFELADALQARNIPFLFFTGYDREMIPARFAAVPRLEKPVDSLRLVQATTAICGRSAAVFNPG